MRLTPQQKRALFFAWLPAALGVLVICAESTDYFSAAHTRDFLQHLGQWLFGSARQLDWNTGNHILRKTGHFIGYGTLSLLFYRGWRRSGHILSIRKPRIVDVVFSFGCTLAVASADEFHQSFLPSRTSSARDVFLDTAGAALFLLLFQLWLLFRGRRRPVQAI